MAARTRNLTGHVALGLALSALWPAASAPAQTVDPRTGETLRLPGLPGVPMPPGARVFGPGQNGGQPLTNRDLEHLFGDRRPQTFPAPTLGSKGNPFGRPRENAAGKPPPPKPLTPAERAAQIRKALAPKPQLAFVRRHTLDDLFGKLSVAKDVDEAKGIAAVITGIWMRSGSDTADLLMQRSLEALQKKQYKVALHLLDRLVEVRPGWAEAWNKRASVRFFSGDYNGAMADVEHVLKLEPKHFGALVGMASILHHTGFEKRALEVYRHALSIYPHQPEIEKIAGKLALEVEGQGI